MRNDLLKKNGVKSAKVQSPEQRIAELEQIIAEQDEALMELAALIVGGDEDE